jgi:hypothetical protein
MNAAQKPWLALLGGLALGCTSGGGGGGADESGTGDGGPACFERYDWEILSNPDFKNTISGVVQPASYGVINGPEWDSVAFGHIDPGGFAGCCLDYAVASSDRSEVYVYYGTGAPGLSVVQSETPQILDAGISGNIEDLAIVDLDGDGRLEVVALTTSSVLVVWQGTTSAPWLDPMPLTVSASHTSGGVAHTGHSQIVIADVDCNGVGDVLMPANGGVVIRRNGRGLLDRAGFVDLGEDVREIAVADLDHDGDLDIGAATEVGDARVALHDACNNPFFGPEDTYAFSPPFNPIGRLNVAFGQVCPDHPNDNALLFSHGDDVMAWCGDGSGSFDNVQQTYASGSEEPTGIDYRWDVTTDEGSLIADIAAYPGFQEVFVLGNVVPNGTHTGVGVVKLTPSGCGPQIAAARAVPVTLPGAMFGKELLLQPATLGASTWDRLASAGGDGLQVAR